MSYKSLFTRYSTNLSKPGGKNYAEKNMNQDFLRRFGFARIYERNQNLITTATKPTEALNEVNDAIYENGNDKAKRYQHFLTQYRVLGFPDEEAIARADMLIAREIENDLSLMQVKYPYALGGAAAGGWDPITHLLKDSDIREAPNTFAAIQRSNGLGVGSKGISKGEKKRLIRKGKRRGRRQKE